MARALRNFAVLSLLLWGLVLPKATAILLELNPNITTVVICTGTQMVTIMTRADGTPVEVDTEDTGPCVVADPLALDKVDVPEWVTLARSYATPFIPKTSLTQRHDAVFLPRVSQGPPVGAHA